jgi:hypothetical protein
MDEQRIQAASFSMAILQSIVQTQGDPAQVYIAFLTGCIDGVTLPAPMARAGNVARRISAG